MTWVERGHDVGSTLTVLSLNVTKVILILALPPVHSLKAQPDKNYISLSRKMNPKFTGIEITLTEGTMLPSTF